MRPETQRAETFAGASRDTVTCPSCRAEMVSEMRFCRACGFRLGEGLDEYVETVRLDGMPHMAPPQTARTTFGAGFAPQTTSLAPGATQNNLSRRRQRRARACGNSGAGWLTWVIIVMIIAGASGAARAVRRRARAGGGGGFIQLAQRSFIGVNDFDSVRGGGAMLDAVLPGTPAALAGLRDGDLIQRFDGKTINSEEEMRDALRRTPVGKTVEVAYTRDGTPRTTMLKTIASGDYNARAFMPAGGSGYWGVSSLERVPVPGEDSYGVRLGSVSANRPADIAGLQPDDIVVSFDGDPVRTVAGLSSYIDHAAPGSVVRVGVVRNAQRLEVPVKMGRDD